MLISVISSSNHKLYVQREQFPYKDLHMSEKISSGIYLFMNNVIGKFKCDAQMFQVICCAKVNQRRIDPNEFIPPHCLMWFAWILYGVFYIFSA